MLLWEPRGTQCTVSRNVVEVAARLSLRDDTPGGGSCRSRHGAIGGSILPAPPFQHDGAPSTAVDGRLRAVLVKGALPGEKRDGPSCEQGGAEQLGKVLRPGPQCKPRCPFASGAVVIATQAHTLLSCTVYNHHLRWSITASGSGVPALPAACADLALQPHRQRTGIRVCEYFAERSVSALGPVCLSVCVCVAGGVKLPAHCCR